MALTAHLSFPLLLPCYRHHAHLNPNPNPNPTLSFGRSRIRAVGSGDMLGDFGARDPFPAEVESRFAEKVLGNAGTDHKILIPNLSAFSLSQQQCIPLSPFQVPFTADEAQKLLKKVSFNTHMLWMPMILFLIMVSLLVLDEVSFTQIICLVKITFTV